MGMAAGILGSFWVLGIEGGIPESEESQNSSITEAGKALQGHGAQAVPNPQ